MSMRCAASSMGFIIPGSVSWRNRKLNEQLFPALASFGDRGRLSAQACRHEGPTESGARGRADPTPGAMITGPI